MNKNVIFLRKDESIAFIKHMGRLHSMLCGIMDMLNFCFSLKVFCFSFLIVFFFIFNSKLWVNSCKCTNIKLLIILTFHEQLNIYVFMYFPVLDNGWNSGYFCFYHLNILLILSIYSLRKHFLQNADSSSHKCEHIFYVFHICGHLLWKCHRSRGKNISKYFQPFKLNGMNVYLR